MAFLIQERKACQPLTHFKPDCVKEWEEQCTGAEGKNIQEKIADAWGQKKQEKSGVQCGQQRAGDKGRVWDRSVRDDVFYDTHLSQEWSAALIW